jgi:hypothetical protein
MYINAHNTQHVPKTFSCRTHSCDCATVQQSVYDIVGRLAADDVFGDTA